MDPNIAVATTTAALGGSLQGVFHSAMTQIIMAVVTAVVTALTALAGYIAFKINQWIEHKKQESIIVRIATQGTIAQNAIGTLVKAAFQTIDKVEDRLPWVLAKAKEKYPNMADDELLSRIEAEVHEGKLAIQKAAANAVAPVFKVEK